MIIILIITDGSVAPPHLKMLQIPDKNSNDDIICQCHQVTESVIRSRIAENDLSSVEQVTKACEAGGGCHSCHMLIQLFIDQHKDQDRPAEALVAERAAGKVPKKGFLGGFFSRFKPAAKSSVA